MPSLLSRRDEVRLLRLARSQPATAGELLELIEEIKERTIEAVLAEERVRARMKGVRYRVLAADYREDKPTGEEKRPRRLAEVGLYDYDKDILVVAVVDLHQGTVLAIEERPGVQPPVTEDEIKAASELITSSHQHHARLNQPGTAVVAFPTPRYIEGHARERHRCVTLYFSPGPGQNETQITVDLMAEEVVSQEELVSGSPRLGLGSSPNR
jgi:Cu2+-containing amine oxidase